MSSVRSFILENIAKSVHLTISLEQAIPTVPAASVSNGYLSAVLNTLSNISNSILLLFAS